MGKLGSTNQKVAALCSLNRFRSCVSRHSHIIPKIDTKGNDATSAPQPG